MGSPRSELIVCKFQDPRCGSTRPLAFNGTASKPLLWVDSPAGVQWNSFKSSAVGRLARRRLMKKPRDHPRWSTRQPRWRLMSRGRAGVIDKPLLCTPWMPPSGLPHRRRSRQGDAREGSGTPGRREPTECERCRADCSGPSLHVRPGGRQKYGEATAEVHALRAGSRFIFFVTLLAAPPIHTKVTQDQTVDHAPHHILCRYT